MQRYLISYEFTDGEDQEEGAEMLINWYESGGPQNRPENYEVHSWIFMVQRATSKNIYGRYRFISFRWIFGRSRNNN